MLINLLKNVYFIVYKLGFIKLLILWELGKDKYVICYLLLGFGMMLICFI